MEADSPPASECFITTSVIVSIFPKSIVKVCALPLLAHHLVFSFPSTAISAASDVATELDAVTDFPKARLGLSIFAEFETVINPSLTITSLPNVFLAFNVTEYTPSFS